jgi:hypothetical protein
MFLSPLLRLKDIRSSFTTINFHCLQPRYAVPMSIPMSKAEEMYTGPLINQSHLAMAQNCLELYIINIQFIEIPYYFKYCVIFGPLRINRCMKKIMRCNRQNQVAYSILSQKFYFDFLIGKIGVALCSGLYGILWYITGRCIRITRAAYYRIKSSARSIHLNIHSHLFTILSHSIPTVKANAISPPVFME